MNRLGSKKLKINSVTSKVTGVNFYHKDIENSELLKSKMSKYKGIPLTSKSSFGRYTNFALGGRSIRPSGEQTTCNEKEQSMRETL